MRGRSQMAIYLDHAATTPMLPEAIDAYVRAMRVVGNPASVHSQGQNAKRMLEEAREPVAASLGCAPIPTGPPILCAETLSAATPA